MEKDSRLGIGLFQGRDLKMEEDPWPVTRTKAEWGATKGTGSLNTQSPLWCISSDGKFKTPDCSGMIPAKTSWEEKRFNSRDMITVILCPDQQEMEFLLTPTARDESGCKTELTTAEGEPGLLLSLPLGSVGEAADDLHLFVTLYSKGDAVTMHEIEDCK
jgi:hypothetical protein